MTKESTASSEAGENSHEAPYEWLHLPEAIYFDSNALISAGFALDRPWLTEFRSEARLLGIGLRVPELVFQEWFRRFKEHVREQASKLRAIAGSLSQIGISVPSLPQSFDGESDEALTRYAESLFEKAGLERVQTPALELSDLLTDAVAANAPFEGGDKGFRDTVIVETVANHAANTLGFSRVLMVSADGAIRRSGPRFAKYGVEVVFCEAKDALAVLDAMLEKEHASLRKHRDTALEQLVAKESARVLEYVRNTKLSLSDSQLRGYGDQQDVWGDIRAVRSVTPKSIDGVSTLLRPLHGELGRDRLGFSIFVKVDIELDLEIISGGTNVLAELLRGLEVTPSLVSPEEPLVVPKEESRPFTKRRILKAVERLLTVDASVDAERAKQSKYADLRFHAVH